MIREGSLHVAEGAESAEEVVRVFLLQPTASEKIDAMTDLRNISLTQVVLSQKGSAAVNAGQIMPIGGNIGWNETIEAGAQREALEETHLIFSNLKVMRAKQEYSFRHRGEKKRRFSHFLIGQLFSPKYDTPYPLDPKTDKIERFVSVDVAHLQDALLAGEVSGNPVLDSLHPNEEFRKTKGTVANAKEIEAIRDELLENARQAELTRKMRVMKILLSKGFGNTVQENVRDEFHRLEQRIEMSTESGNVEVYENVNEFWGNYIVELSRDSDTLKVAIRFSNIQDVLMDLQINAQTNTKALPTAHMMFPIMFGFNFDKRLQPLLLENQHLAKITAMSRILYLYNLVANGDGRAMGAERLLRRIVKVSPETPLNEQSLNDYFRHNGFLPADFPRDFKEVADQIDHFFQTLQKQSKIPPELASLSHTNEVEEKSFERILQLAFKHPFSQKEKRTKFEAQRKLLLTYMLFEVQRFYQQVRKRGIEPLDDLESELETADSIAPQNNQGGRKIMLAGTIYDVTLERRPKELESLLRKVLERDDWNFTETSHYIDIYGESYIFDEHASTSMTEIPRPVPCAITDGKDRSLSEYIAPQVVHDFISELVEKASRRDEVVSIVRFKGLPEEGKGFDSDSASGGAPIRLCKFFVRHVARDGVSRIREVQMFLPRVEAGKWVSGQKDHDFKKGDDVHYALSRLFTHGNVYSIIELLFPYDIYGDSMKRFFKPAPKNDGADWSI